MVKSRTAGATQALPQKPPRKAKERAPGHATRETVESIAIAVILAFLFRAFVAEAFVIPTGSMAPTLMGQHKDVKCPECDFWYQAGASIEIENQSNDQRLFETAGAASGSMVVGATCPVCRYRQLLDIQGDRNKATFSGDRILVSKFIYDFTSPKRWDVIVFKYPFNAKQNFIKRLIGLPGETILIRHGDVFVKQPGQEEFEIARKPDHKLRTILQMVDDSKYVAKSLVEVNWPERWQPWEADGGDATGFCTSEDGGHSYRIRGDADRDIWLRYHHVVPTADDWDMISELVHEGEQLTAPDEYAGTLISDFYAYNAFTSIDRRNLRSFDPLGDPEDLPPSLFGSQSLHPFGTLGLHWVGDLALEGEVDIESDEGELLLQLTKGGVAYACRIDLTSGAATLSIGDGTAEFTASDGSSARAPVGQTKIKGSGQYSICYSNVDAELRLWVNGKRIQFDGPTTYAPGEDVRPVATLEDPGDLAPLGIGTRGGQLHLRRLRVLRDVYYVATEGIPAHEYRIAISPERIRRILDDPTTWASSKLFASRDSLTHELAADQYLPLGDNSPQSSDARMWPKHYFERQLLIGRALLIYWPHPWYRPIPYLPNVKRMRLIH